MGNSHVFITGSLARTRQALSGAATTLRRRYAVFVPGLDRTQ
jgi:hypothetical protein